MARSASPRFDPDTPGESVTALSAPDHRNEVHLVGRVSAVTTEQTLPSGDLIAGFRVVVSRPPEARAPGARATSIDVIDCRVVPAGLRRTLRGLHPGDVVQIDGRLRRRFFRASEGLSSRYEVDVTALRRVYRPG